MPPERKTPLHRSQVAVVDLNDASGNARVVLDARGLATLGAQLALEPGSSAGSVVIKIRGRSAFLEPSEFGPGDDRDGPPYHEIDPQVRLTAEGTTSRNLDVERFAQVEAIVTEAAGAPATGRLALYGEGRARA